MTKNFYIDVQNFRLNELGFALRISLCKYAIRLLRSQPSFVMTS
ncbi:hypothetical protein [Pseudanabaena sp. 'Roaring Creek']|nr:hypothetical protein [Pseudanabaena sp. 'Roaring Creek']